MTDQPLQPQKAKQEEKDISLNNTIENSTDSSHLKEGGKRNNRRRRNDQQRGPREAKEFEEAILQIDRVTRVVAGGRRLRFRVSVVIGDQKGRVGFGIGKSGEVMIGIQKAVSHAKRNLITVPIFQDTIPHPVSAKFNATEVFILPAPAGKGIIAGGAVRKILELAGVHDVLSKIHHSRNRINAAYATMEALKKLQNREPKKKENKESEIKNPESEGTKKEVKVEKSVKKEVKK